MYRKRNPDGTYAYSDGRIIRTEGAIVINPTHDTLAANGWEEYVPPAVEAGPRLEPGMDDVLDALKRLADDTVLALPDGTAGEVAALFPTWESMLGKSVEVGDRHYYDGSLFKAIQAHTVQADWNPRAAASLWANVSDGLSPEAGTVDNPMAWEPGMTAYNGKYYTEDGRTYRCTRDSGNPLHFAISALIGHYFESV